jgi:capsular polysaccharide biosynthesis protein
MEEKNSIVEVNLKELFFVLVHKLWLIAIIGILGGILACLFSTYYLTPYYTSSTQVYVINRQDDNMITYADLQTGSSLAHDYMILIKSRPVMQEVITRLGINLADSQLASMISVSTPADSRVMEITVTYIDPEKAQLLADTIAEVSAERMVSIMGMEKVNIVEKANYPGAPSGPDIQMNTLIGGLVGAFLTAFVLVIIYLLNDNIKTAEDIEKYLGITVLGIIPLEEDTGRKKGKKSQGKIKAA